MEENFNKILEKIKDDTLDQEETKEYILAIKGVIKQAYENCKDEQSQEKIISEFIEEYEKDLSFRGNGKSIYGKMLRYVSYKGLTQAYDEKRSGFYNAVSEAKKLERKNPFEKVGVEISLKQCMISAVRNIIRTKKLTEPKDILEVARGEQNKLGDELRTEMTRVLHSSIGFLEEYGFIDKYIEASNKDLEEIGLSELKFSKRNPIADEQYDEQGNLIYDVEDIGIIDTFLEDNLENYSLEDMAFMTGFWESKYFQERLGISKAMSTIKSLNLWDALLHEDDEAIKGIEFEKMTAALKKDVAITTLCRSDVKITDKMRRQYRKFVQANGLTSDQEIDVEIENEKAEIDNLEETSRDVIFLEGLIMQLLNKKDVQIDKWGIVEEAEEKENNQDEDGFITIAIENKTFRGPLLMGVTKNTLKSLFNDKVKIPKYEKEIDETYCNIMANLYLPINKFFINTVNKAYERNPESKTLANLVGGEVKPVGDER